MRTIGVFIFIFFIFLNFLFLFFYGGENVGGLIILTTEAIQNERMVPAGAVQIKEWLLRLKRLAQVNNNKLDNKN